MWDDGNCSMVIFELFNSHKTVKFVIRLQHHLFPHLFFIFFPHLNFNTRRGW